MFSNAKITGPSSTWWARADTSGQFQFRLAIWGTDGERGGGVRKARQAQPDLFCAMFFGSPTAILPDYFLGLDVI